MVKKILTVLIGTIYIASIAEHVIASSWNPLVLVNTEAFQTIDEGDSTTDVILRFGDTLNKTITFDRTNTRFDFNDDLYVQGGLEATGTITGTTLIALDNITINSNNTATDAVLTFGNDLGSETLRFNDTTNAFVFSDDLTVNGNLTVTGSTTLNTVTYTWPSAMASNTGAALTVTPTTGQMSWDGPFFKRINGSTGEAGPYMTLQNLTGATLNCTTIALCNSVMTTTSVTPGTWKFKYTVIYQTAAVGTGIGFGINHTGTVSQFQAMWNHITTGGGAATGIGDDDATTVAGQLMEGKSDNTLNAVIGSATAGVATANSDILATIEGIIVVTATGNLELKIASEVNLSAVRLMEDSMLELTKIE
jgi:hypothetical protein